MTALRLALVCSSLIAEPALAEGQLGGSSSCEEVSNFIEYCPGSAAWKRTFARPGMTAQFVSSFQIEAGVSFSAQIISEQLDTEGQLSSSDARAAVIANTSAVSEATGSTLEFLIDEQRTVFGLPSTLLVYAIDSEGVPVIFVNSVVTGKYHVTQFITWRLGTSLRQEDYDVHSDFLDNLRVMN